MKMPRFLAAALLTALAFIPVIPARTADRKPNILFILTDDQGWPELGVHGNPDIETPNMDRLASEGVRFSHFYASPVCSPTRAALMTGRYPQRTGAIDTYYGHDVLAADEITIADTLHGAGYHKGAIGKWHLGRYARYHPQSRGFDDYFGFWQYGFINRYFDSDELFEGRTPVTTAGYITDVLADRAVRFLQENRKRPFFCYVPFNAPHSPRQAPEKLVSKYLKKGLDLENAEIYAMIDSLDENIGEILKAVDDLGLRKDTLVVFMTDNGYTSSHFSAGLRGKKGSVFEGGIRVPFMARWPGKIPAGKVVDVPAQHIDVFPTFCEAAGAPLPAGRKLDGVSLLPLLRNGGGEAPHRYLYHQWTRVKPSVDENWAIHEGNLKLADGKLYDLSADPGETKDLSDRMPDKASELRRAFKDWFADVTAGRTYEPPPIEVGRPDENPVELDLTWAETVGKVKATYRHYNRDRTENWNHSGEGLRWKVDVVTAGTYDVTLEYGCLPSDAGGKFHVSGQGAGARLDAVTQAGGEEDVYVSRVVGQVQLTAGPQQIEMLADKVPGKSLMELHRVYLRRRE